MAGDVQRQRELIQWAKSSIAANRFFQADQELRERGLLVAGAATRKADCR